MSKINFQSTSEFVLNRQCFCCGQGLQSAIEAAKGEKLNDFSCPSAGATTWITHGNFGSTVYDPLDDNKYLKIEICDQCLAKNADRVCEVRVTDRQIDAEVRQFIATP